MDHLDVLLASAPSTSITSWACWSAIYSLWSVQVLDMPVVLVGDRLWTYVPFYGYGHNRRRPPPRWYCHFWKPNLLALFIVHFLVLPTVLLHILSAIMYLTSEWE